MNTPKPNRIDDLDQRIDRTLDTLGKAQPSSDLHDRLLTALDGHSRHATHGVLSTAVQRSGEAPIFKGWRLFGFASAALAASLAAFVLLPRHPAPKQDRARNLENGRPAKHGAHRHPRPLPISPPTRVPHLHRQLHRRLRWARPPPINATKSHPTQVAASLELSTAAPLTLDQQALADLHAPSQPAPPLPPTAQERLVRLMLRQGETTQLAKLDLARDPEIERAELTAFHNFFDPPAAIQEDPAPKQEQSSPTASDKVPQP